MDNNSTPTSNQQLDPKLRAAYDRIMGAATDNTASNPPPEDKSFTSAATVLPNPFNSSSSSVISTLNPVAIDKTPTQTENINLSQQQSSTTTSNLNPITPASSNSTNSQNTATNLFAANPLNSNPTSTPQSQVNITAVPTPVRPAASPLINTSAPAPIENKPAEPITQSSVSPAPVVNEKVDKNNPEVHGFVAHRSDKKISPVIIGAAVVVFLIFYTFFWIKVLNVSL